MQLKIKVLWANFNTINSTGFKEFQKSSSQL